MSGGQLGAIRASEWGPEDVGFLTWPYDPVLATAATTYASGDVGVSAALLRRPARATTLYVATTASAVGAVGGQNFLGLFDANGVPLSVVGIDAQVAAANGTFAIPLAAPVTLQPQRLYAVQLQNAATSVAPWVRANGAADAGINTNLLGTLPRGRTILTGQTALPSPAVYSAGVLNKGFWWALA